MYLLRTFTCTFVLSIFCMTGSQLSHAGFYKWVDDKGVTHYSASLPNGVASKKQQKFEVKDRLIGTTSPLPPMTTPAAKDDSSSTPVVAQPSMPIAAQSNL